MPRTNSIEIIRKTLDLAGHELQILHQISQTISCSLDPDQILRHIIDLVVDVTRGDSCLLYLLDETEQSLILRASKNPHPGIIGNISLKVGEGITGWVAGEAKRGDSRLRARMPASSSFIICRRTVTKPFSRFPSSHPPIA